LKIYPGPLDVKRWEDGFSIFKLNGTTGFKTNRGTGHLHDEFEIKDPERLLKQFITHYALTFLDDNNKVTPLLSFAWESDWREDTRTLLETAQKAVQNSDVLVIIGYSIPFFNRRVDRQVLSSLAGSVKSIYIQDKYPDAVKEKLPSIWGTYFLPEHIELKDNTDQFFLPPEI
jgi:hypothetical protein